MALLALAAPACSARGGGGGIIFDASGDGVTPGDNGPTDTGTTPPVDSGTPMDTGAPPEDTGTPPEDTGTPPVTDTGFPVTDTGFPVTDTGTPPVDRPVTGVGYTRTSTSATMVSACTLPGVTRLLASADDDSATLPAPFTLRFFGTSLPALTPLYISSNGFISTSMFDPGEATIVGTIPTATAPNGLIAAYWADLVMGTQGVCAVVVGTAPERRLIVQWANGTFYSGVATAPTAGSANFEVIYNEVDASIDFIYETISGQPEGAPTRAAVGVEDPAGAGFAVCPGGHLGRTPPPPNCTEVTSGTRFRLVPTT